MQLLQAKGKTHLTKEQIEERKNSEISVDFIDIQAPKQLSKKLQKEFLEIANKLVAIGIFTELDEDNLARYLLARESYFKYFKLLNDATKDGDIKGMELYMHMQNKFFTQCRASANDLGLTVTSRCKLVVPKAPAEEEKNPFEDFEV